MRVSTLAKLIGIIIFALLLSFCFKPGYALEESDSYDDLPLDEALLHNSDKEDVEDNDDFEADYLPEENERKNLDSDNDGTDPYILSYSSDETAPDNAAPPIPTTAPTAAPNRAPVNTPVNISCPSE